MTVGFESLDSQAQEWAKKGYEVCLPKVLTLMEKAERKEASARGQRAGDAQESRACGSEAGKCWATMKQAMTCVPHGSNHTACATCGVRAA